MAGFDWNGNGKSDLFDHYMNMKSMSNSSSKISNKKEEKSTDNNAKTDSNGTVIVKSLIAIGLCVLAFAICLSGDVGKLGMAILHIGAAILGYNILK